MFIGAGLAEMPLLQRVSPSQIRGVYPEFNEGLTASGMVYPVLHRMVTTKGYSRRVATIRNLLTPKTGSGIIRAG